MINRAVGLRAIIEDDDENPEDVAALEDEEEFERKRNKKKQSGEEVPLLAEIRRGNDDDDQDQGGIGLRVQERQLSETYKLEIEDLRNERDMLLHELQEKDILLPKMQEEFEAKNKELEDALIKLTEELQMIKSIEDFIPVLLFFPAASWEIVIHPG